jgi:hypothetical protein
VRATAAALLALLGIVVGAVGVTAVWGRNQVLDTDRYLRTIEPLASDPVIQDELAAKVTDAITARIEATDPRLGAVRPLVEAQAQAFLRSDEFATVWVELNRAGHEQLVRILTDSDGRISIELDPVVAAVRELVADAGLQVVRTIPPISLVVDVAEVEGIEEARTTVRTLDRLAHVLPVLALLLLGLAVVSARRRLRAGAWVAGGLAVVSLLFLGVVRLGGSVAAGRVPASAASDEAVRAYYEHLTALLRHGYVTLAVLGAVVCAGCATLARWRSGSPAR